MFRTFGAVLRSVSLTYSFGNLIAYAGRGKIIPKVHYTSRADDIYVSIRPDCLIRSSLIFDILGQPAYRKFLRILLSIEQLEPSRPNLHVPCASKWILEPPNPLYLQSDISNVQVPENQFPLLEDL